MNRLPQHELRASERPIRSDYALERSYARRRITTVIVLVLIIGGIIYMAFGRGPSTPTEVPTIKAEGSYKQKPADPGGIDIPHQDVRVYDELESKATPQTPVEHLLPPAETPQEAPRPIAQAAPVAPVPAPAPTPAPVASVAITPPPSSVPTKTSSGEGLSETRIVKTIDTTVVPVPAPAPVPVTTVAPVSAASIPAPTKTSTATEVKGAAVAPKQAPLSIEQIIANTKASAPSSLASTSSKSATVSSSTGSVAIQLASASDEAKAEAMMKDLQQKYATQLGSAVLHLSRADLGSKGIYYRIQSQSLAENDANQICSALKQINAGCILVRK